MPRGRRAAETENRDSFCCAVRACVLRGFSLLFLSVWIDLEIVEQVLQA